MNYSSPKNLVESWTDSIVTRALKASEVPCRSWIIPEDKKCFEMSCKPENVETNIYTTYLNLRLLLSIL